MQRKTNFGIATNLSNGQILKPQQPNFLGRKLIELVGVIPELIPLEQMILKVVAAVAL